VNITKSWAELNARKVSISNNISRRHFRLSSSPFHHIWVTYIQNYRHMDKRKDKTKSCHPWSLFYSYMFHSTVILRNNYLHSSHNPIKSFTWGTHFITRHKLPRWPCNSIGGRTLICEQHTTAHCLVNWTYTSIVSPQLLLCANTDLRPVLCGPKVAHV
jgi:hypothetical protein